MTEQLDDFMGYLARLGLGAATVQLYFGAVRRATEGICSGCELTDILEDESLGASRRETYRKALFHWAAYLGDERLSAKLRAWTPGKHAQRVKGEALALDIEEEWPRLRKAVLCHEDRALAAVLYLLLTTGLRIAEVLNLTGEKLAEALATGEADILQKGQKPRKLLLPTEEMKKQAQVLATKLVSSHDTVEDTIRTDRRRSRKGVEDYVRRELQALAAGLGIKGRVTPHVGRRTVGDAVYESSGHDLRAVREMLGQAPGSRVTERWYQDHIRKGVAGKALGRALEEKDDE